MDKRLLRIVADTSLGQAVRMEALLELVESLPEGHPYRREPLECLYDRILPDYATRMYLENGRGVEKLVSRPPLTLADIL